MPTIRMPLDQSDVYGDGWLEGTEVTLTIDDLDTAEWPDYTDRQTAEGDTINFNLHGWMPEPGEIVTMGDGVITKTHVVANVHPHREKPGHSQWSAGTSISSSPEMPPQSGR